MGWWVACGMVGCLWDGGLLVEWWVACELVGC